MGKTVGKGVGGGWKGAQWDAIGRSERNETLELLMRVCSPVAYELID